MPPVELLLRIVNALPSSHACNWPTSFYSIPGKHGPRWLVPCGENLHRVLAQWSPYRVSSRLKWSLIQASQSLHSTGLLPGVERVQPDHPAGVNWQALGWNGTAAPVPLIYIGTPGPRQKAVIHLINPVSGDCQAIVKVPLRAGAREFIVREGNVLSVLEDECFSAAPELLFSDGARSVTTQQFLSGRSGNRRFLPEYHCLLRSLVIPDEHTTIAGHAAEWHDHPLWDFMEGPEIKLMSNALAEQADTYRLPAYWVHGDFAPWNIRDRRNDAPALIDWEYAHRAGLPLQDAFHFFHIQDYLFSASPRTHHAMLQGFAGRIGISQSLCRKLELAYLTQSYFTCRAWEEPRRAEFVRQALVVTLQERSHAAVYSSDRASRRLRLVASHPTNRLAARAELLDSVTSELDHEGIPYCLLSGYESAAAASGSDVDIMFRPRDLARIPAILAKAAEAKDAHLVQSIRHETSACYFVLARAQGKHVLDLAVDVYGDYRRDGRTWLCADDIIAHRRRYRDFYRPAIADEFIYRLLKKVLKQTVTADHLKQLQHLFVRDAAGCRARLARFWPQAMAGQMERVIVEQNLRWFRERLPLLLEILRQSRAVQGRFLRFREAVGDTVRCLARVLRPTGIVAVVCGDEGSVSSELADRIQCSLAPAFRRTRSVEALASFKSALQVLPALIEARLRSTLVIEAAASEQTAILPKIGSQLLRMILKPNLTLRLVSRSWDEAGASCAVGMDRDGVLCLDGDEFPEELARQANEAALHWLANRTAKRLRLPEASLRCSLNPAVEIKKRFAELESVGSD